jgi:hypothetical protein
MSDKKMIIRNCPICEHCDWDNGYGELEEGYICKRITIDSFECKDIENCLLKRIVKLAKGYKEELIDRKTKKVVATRYFKLTKEILELLDIEEVE